MNKIKFNNFEAEVDSYNKTTYLGGDTIMSNANCSIRTSEITTLNNLMLDIITSIQIFSNDILIYDLQNIRAKIDNVTESFGGDRMYVNVNFSFLPPEEDESQILDNE